jgi:hypothetical protein
MQRDLESGIGPIHHEKDTKLPVSYISLLKLASKPKLLLDVWMSELNA